MDKNTAAPMVTTVWRDGTWKHWCERDAICARDDGDWLLEIPAAPAQSAEPVRHVGDSNFEGWYQDYAARITGNPKQTARDAYAAGLNEAAQDVSTGVCFFCGESMDGQHEADCPQSSQPSQTAVVLDERAAFEAWAQIEGYDVAQGIHNGYESMATGIARNGWQARAASSQPVEQTRARPDREWYLQHSLKYDVANRCALIVMGLIADYTSKHVSQRALFDRLPEVIFEHVQYARKVVESPEGWSLEVKDLPLP